MVILTEPYGQRSNVFFQHIHLDSFCRANNIAFKNPHLYRYIPKYPNLKDYNKATFFEENSMFSFLRWCSKSGIIPHLCFNDEASSKEYERLILEKALIKTCSGWSFRSFSTTIQYRNLYRKLFQPKIDKEYLNRNLINKDDESQILIGLHIRRTDYESFQNGIFYYNDNVYIEKLTELLQILNLTNYKISIVTDDTELNYELYAKTFREITLSINDDVTDQYILSKCDYILGPPSTFSLWASYMGEKLYYHIADVNRKVSLSDFNICNG